MPASVKSPVFTSMVHRKVQPKTSWQGEGARGGRARGEVREGQVHRNCRCQAFSALYPILLALLRAREQWQHALAEIRRESSVGSKALALAMSRSVQFGSICVRFSSPLGLYTSVTQHEHIPRAFLFVRQT